MVEIPKIETHTNKINHRKFLQPEDLLTRSDPIMLQSGGQAMNNNSGNPPNITIWKQN